MKKIHTLTIALLLGAAAVFGMIAATRTVGLRAAQTKTPPSSTAAITARAHRLDRVEASLRRALRDKPPALPAVPAVTGRQRAMAASHVIYRRPAPILIVKHTSHHDDLNDHESDLGGGDD